MMLLGRLFSGALLIASSAHAPAFAETVAAGVTMKRLLSQGGVVVQMEEYKAKCPKGVKFSAMGCRRERYIVQVVDQIYTCEVIFGDVAVKPASDNCTLRY